MGSEPELTVHRIPDAAAIVFMLGADTGVTRTDRELWSEHIEPIHGIENSCYVVLNKIDGLRDGFKPETQVLGEIDRQVASSAETDRKSTRLNSSHGYISYAVFCLKKKKKQH